MLNALIFKAESNHQIPESWFAARAYSYKLLKIVPFDTPNPHSVSSIYVDPKKEELSKLFPLGMILSLTFRFGGPKFFIVIRCKMNQ